jgi:DNA-binding transcriptional MerR regulator
MEFGTGHYGYGLLERALGAALGVGEQVQRGALRARLKRMAQLGLPPPMKDQKGRRLYSQEELHTMLVALLLGNLGLDPMVVARAVKKAWKQNLRQGAIEAAREADAVPKKQIDNPMVLHATLRVVSAVWDTGNPNTALTITGLQRRFKRDSDLVVNNFESLVGAEWSAVLDYTEAAIDMHRALNRGE